MIQVSESGHLVGVGVLGVLGVLGGAGVVVGVGAVDGVQLLSSSLSGAPCVLEHVGAATSRKRRHGRRGPASSCWTRATQQ